METDKGEIAVFHENTEAHNYDKISINAVNDLSDTNFSAKDITPEYLPLILDKIFDDSDELFIVDTDNDINPNYSYLMEKFLNSKKEIQLYSRNDNPFPNKKNLNFHSLTNSEISRLNSNDYKNVVIGDQTRFVLNKVSTVEHFYTLGGIIMSLIGVGNPKTNIAPKSVVNFKNPDEAATIIRKVRNIINP